MDEDQIKKEAEEAEESRGRIKKRLRKEDHLRKEAEATEKPPQKQFYTVKLEVMAPVELTMRVFAETPQDAVDMVSRNPLPPLSGPPRPTLSRLRRVKATVYKAGTTIYYLVKNYTR